MTVLEQEKTTQDEATCAGRRADGKLCESTILLEDGYCRAHSPSRAKPKTKRSFWREVAADAERQEQRRRAARDTAEKRRVAQLAKKRELERQRRREEFWGKELIALGRGIRFCWRYSRSKHYRTQVKAHVIKEVASSLGPGYRAWKWQKAYRHAPRDERRQMLGHAVFGPRVVSAWRFVRNEDHRAKTKARWRYQAVQRFYTGELRTVVRASRWTGRRAMKSGRALVRAYKTYKQQWYVSGYTRADGTYVRGHQKRRRTL